jgi:hypothetical protein
MSGRAFSAPYDSTTKTVSAVVCLFLIVVAFLVHVIFVALLFPLLILLAYAYSPRGYAITGDAIVIRRLIGNVRVPLAGVREVRAGTRDDFTGVLRLWGNGGLFGYYGLFRTAKLGRSHWYVTDRSKTVIVITATSTMVLSPDDVPGFIAAAGADSTAIPPGNTPHITLGGNRLGKFLGIGVAGLAVALVSLSFLYSPGPPAYTLSADKLAIHDLFYPAILYANAVDTAHIRVVDLSPGSPWRPTLRTNGFANQHYQSGWFRVANGKKVRLYSAGAMRLVLIPPKGNGTFVLLHAKDPDGFVQELQAQWSGH